MTQATRSFAAAGSHADSPTSSAVTPDRHEAARTGRPPAPSGWYDPDGAAWEAESPASAEAWGATRIRPPIRVEGVDQGS